MKSSLEKIDVFLKDNATHILEIGKRKTTTIGFNAFALVSDTYYRENFHSDVIRSILDPHSGHGEGVLYLKKFIELVAAEAESNGRQTKNVAKTLRNLSVDDSVEVVREEGHIDVKIMAADWTIIVENKINGASDMERQLPRYVRQCCKQRENVVAVVYLTAALPGFPSDYGWKKGDMEMVKPLLVPVIGFSETRLRPNGLPLRNLAEDWIGPCSLSTRAFNSKSILEQYAELLRHQSGETMNQDEVKKVMLSMGEHGICRSELLRVFEGMPQVLAEIIVSEFLDRDMVLKRVRSWSRTVAVLDMKDISLKNGAKAELAIDIHCEDLKGLGISLLSRNDSVAPKILLSLFKEYDSGFDTGWGDRIVLSMDTDWACAHVNKFLARIGTLVDFLEKNWKRIEAICRGDGGARGNTH